nr:MAG TPA: hypothetical protein [Bacteriophage sp.]
MSCSIRSYNFHYIFIRIFSIIKVKLIPFFNTRILIYL